MAHEQSAITRGDAKARRTTKPVARPEPPRPQIVYEGASFFTLPGKKVTNE